MTVDGVSESDVWPYDSHAEPGFCELLAEVLHQFIGLWVGEALRGKLGDFLVFLKQDGGYHGNP